MLAHCTFLLNYYKKIFYLFYILNKKKETTLVIFQIKSTSQENVVQTYMQL